MVSSLSTSTMLANIGVEIDIVTGYSTGKFCRSVVIECEKPFSALVSTTPVTAMKNDLNNKRNYVNGIDKQEKLSERILSALRYYSAERRWSRHQISRDGTSALIG
jgi:hypothetical protein